MNRSLQLLGICVLAGGFMQLGCGGDDGTGSSAITTSTRPWVEETELVRDPMLHVTRDQVVILDLEPAAAGGPALVRNTIPLLLPDALDLRFCIPAEEPYLRELEILTTSGDLVMQTARGDECGAATLPAGHYVVHLSHDGSTLTPPGKKAFLRRAQPFAQVADQSSFLIPDFMAFSYQGRYVVDLPPANPDTGFDAMEATAKTVGVGAVWQNKSDGTMTDDVGTSVKAELEPGSSFCPTDGALFVFGTLQQTSHTVPTFEFEDRGGGTFRLRVQSIPGCSKPSDVDVELRRLQYFNNTTPATFTFTYKGFNCGTECEALQLRQGEVALFSGCNYEGPAYVFSADTADFSIFNDAIQGLALKNNRAASVRVGPDTLAFLYEHAQYGGTNVITGADIPCLDSTALGNGTLSSLQIAGARDYIATTAACEGCILTGVDLSDLDLSGGDFAQARFSNANLRSTSFQGSNLDDADLSGTTTLTDTDFSGASLACTSFDKANVQGATFDTQIELTTDFSCRLGLEGSLLDVATFPLEMWRYLDLTDATVTDASGATLSTVEDPLDLTGAQLSGATVSGAILDGANLGCATPNEKNRHCTELIDSVLNQASLRQVTLVDAALNGARLIHADLAGADLNSAQLLKSPVTLLSANLTGANLKNVNLGGADLSGATLANANWHSSTAGSCNPGTWTGTCATGQGATLSNADLTGAYLNGLDLSDATAQGAKLAGSLLVGATLAGANLSGDPNTGASTTLAGAFLQGADFTDADTSGADFTSAYVDVSSTSGGLLVWQLPTVNLEFTGYTAPSMPPECPFFEYSTQTRVQTIGGNVCPDGNNGADGGRCSDTQWESPLTPIESATPPVSMDITMLPGQCVAADFDF